MDDAAALYSGAVDCKITPLVVFSILDHYMRRNEGQVRLVKTAGAFLRPFFFFSFCRVFSRRSRDRNG